MKRNFGFWGRIFNFRDEIFLFLNRILNFRDEILFFAYKINFFGYEILVEITKFWFLNIFYTKCIFLNEKSIFDTKFVLLETKSLIFYLNLKKEFVLRTTLNPKTKTLVTLNPKTIKSVMTTLIFKTRNDNLRKTFVIPK